jgi:hypothetical protein
MRGPLCVVEQPALSRLEGRSAGRANTSAFSAQAIAYELVCPGRFLSPVQARTSEIERPPRSASAWQQSGTSMLDWRGGP